MPASDNIHDAVKNALLKDGWTITADPFVIQYQDVTVFADLGAEKTLAARRGDRRIVVEAKSFLSPSPMRDLEQALGQYQVYLGLLERTAPEHHLYLAVDHVIFSSFLQRKAIQLILQRFAVSLLVVNVPAEEVVQWID